MRRSVVTAFAVLVLAACGQDTAPALEVPGWAHVAPEQIAEAQKHGVPVAFENDLGMRFVLIPAGTFLMGSPEDEEDRSEDETQHVVTISQPFYMSIHEVTYGDYRVHKPDHPVFALQAAPADSGSNSGVDSLPMSDASWDDASAYAEWLGEREASREYRLPTEAEWEYACRAGTTTRYGWGDDATADAANYDSDATYVRGPVTPVDNGSAPVGRFRPSSWGLYDVHGSVAEWCADWYAAYADGAVFDPQGPSESKAPRVSGWSETGEDVTSTWWKARVLRGGGWSHLPRFCRSAVRLHRMRTDSLDYVGFRLVSPLSESGKRPR